MLNDRRRLRGLQQVLVQEVLVQEALGAPLDLLQVRVLDLPAPAAAAA